MGPQEPLRSTLAGTVAGPLSMGLKNLCQLGFSTWLLEMEDSLLAGMAAQGIKRHLELLSTETQNSLESLIQFAAEPQSNPPPSPSASPDLFALVLKYNIPNSVLNAPWQRNGNITTMTWQIACRDPQEYAFQYDHLDRLTTATYGEVRKSDWTYQNLNRYIVYSLQYDKRGNITKLNRRGATSATAYGVIDQLKYYYQGNQLDSLKESPGAVPIARGFKTQAPAGGGSYAYDANGNLIRDDHKGIASISYNFLNLPTQINFTNGSWIRHTYDARGVKLKTESSAGNVRQYLQGIEYDGSTLQAIYHAQGRCAYLGSGLQGGPVYQYQYTLQDHLGNNRLTFADLNSDNQVDSSEILQETQPSHPLRGSFH